MVMYTFRSTLLNCPWALSLIRLSIRGSFTPEGGSYTPQHEGGNLSNLVSKIKVLQHEGNDVIRRNL